MNLEKWQNIVTESLIFTLQLEVLGQRKRKFASVIRAIVGSQ